MIDNGSSDNTKKYVESNWSNKIEVIRLEKNRGYSGVLILGLTMHLIKKMRIMF